MSLSMPVETAEHDLKSLLERLHLGETVTLVGDEGAPLALLISLKPEPSGAKPITDWDVQLDALAHQIGQTWKSDKSAVKILEEMRR